MPAVEPPPSQWRLPPATSAGADEVVGVGADLDAGTLLAAYRGGLFPMPVGRNRMGWWSPDPRAVLPVDGLHLSRSLRRSMRGLEIRVDTAFDDVVRACATSRRRGNWITDPIARAYGRLHTLGWAHSVEAWSRADGTLVGGLYGVAIGGLFAGESMFHLVPDASKAALVGLVEVIAGGDPASAAATGRLIDCQWRTEHLASLGAVAIPRDDYLRRLAVALRLTPPPAFDGPPPRPAPG